MLIHDASSILKHKLALGRAAQSKRMIESVHAEYVAAVYSEIRADEVASEVPHTYTTARTLLSILRLFTGSGPAAPCRSC